MLRRLQPPCKFGLQQVRSINSKVYVVFVSAPQMMSFEDEAEEPINATLDAGHEESIFCKATKVRPEPTFFWTVGK